VRAVGNDAWIIYAKLSEASADRAIADQVAYVTSCGREVRWKINGHDRLREHSFDGLPRHLV
jgi:hypothetical protein